MWNIEYKGRLKGEIDQISSGKEIPEGAVQFKEPAKAETAMLKGLLVAQPILFPMLVLALYRIISVYGKPEGFKPFSLIVPFLICTAIAFISQYVHEYIHAFLFPKDLKKQIYVAPESGVLFVYCEEMVSKIRFIVVSLGPAVILGMIPFVIWFFATPAWSIQLSLAVLVYAYLMTACAVGDFLNAFNCLRQVPSGGKVFNRGFHSYWIQ